MSDPSGPVDAAPEAATTPALSRARSAAAARGKAAEQRKLIADLKRLLAERTAERDAAQDRETTAVERHTLVTRAVAEGIYDWDIAQNLLWVSPRLIELFGWAESGPGGGARPSQEWNARVHPDDFATYRTALRAALKGETPRLHCEYRIRLSSGEFRWVEDNAVPVRNERNWAVRLVGAVSDVTERKQREQALREALEQQTATAEVLRVINASPGDLAPVFEAILEKAKRLCECAFGVLWTYDGEAYYPVAINAPAAFADALEGVRRIPSGRRSALSRHVAGEEVVHLHDMAAEREVYRTNLGRQAYVDLGGARTALSVALRKDGALFGSIQVFRQEVRPFADAQIALLQSFAAQAVIAMENARLLTETREALERQTATAEILRVISSSPTDVQPTFDAIAKAAARVSGAAAATVHPFDGSLIHIGAVYGYRPGDLDVVASVFPTPPSRGTATGRAILTGEVVHIVDTAADPDFAHARLSQFGTVLSVPMLRDGNPLGAITASRQKIEAFTPPQIDLLKTFADQAVIAIENVRLFNELNARTRDLEESLEYQTATSDVLQVISRSTFDLQPVLDTLLGTAARLCEADQGLMFRRDGEVYQGAAAFNLPADFAAWGLGRSLAPSRGTILGRAVVARQAVQIADVTVDPLYDVPATAALGKVRTLLGVPLLRQGEPIGVITLARQRVEPFSERQIELVRTFADQAVIAIENTRLITETREALEQQQAIAEVLGVINSSPGELQPVFDAMLERAHALCGATYGALEGWDGTSLRGLAIRGLPEPFADLVVKGRQPGPNDPHWALVKGDRFVHIADLATVDDPAERASVELGGFRTFLAVSLRKDNILLGRIVAVRQEVKPFTDKEIGLLESFAAQAVIAMENARLLGELRARTRDLEESLEYQTATSDVLQVISRSTFDLQPVLDTLVETAMRLCGAHSAFIYRREGELYSLAASVGFPPEYEEFIRKRGPIRPYRGGVTGRTALEGRIVHVHDTAADPEYTQRESITLGKTRTALGVPLLRHGEPVGVIALGRQRVEAFSERQIELVRTFADQAVIAIENTRLLTELNGSLEHQRAIAELVQTINASPGDVQPVFDAMVEKAMRLCGAVNGVLRLFDGELFHLAAASGGPQIAGRMQELGPIPPLPGTFFGIIAAGERVLHIADVRETATYRDFPSARERLDLGGIRTWLGVALHKEDALLGAIMVSRQEVKPFSEREIALLQNFAAQAVIAMENARLLGELRERTRDLEESLEYQTATSDVLQVISRSTFDLQPVLQTVIETAVRLCAAEMAGLVTRDGDDFRVTADYAVSSEWSAMTRARTWKPGNDTVVSRALLERRAVHVADIAAEPGHAQPEAITVGKVRTALGVPLLREGEPIGVILLARSQVKPFSERQIELVRTFADQAVIAIENTRLLTELRESLEQQQAIAEVLQVINANPGNLQPVFDAMLDRAMRLSGAAYGHLMTWDGEGFEAKAVQGGIRIGAYIRPQPGFILDRVVRGEPVIHVTNVFEDPAYRASAHFRDMVDDGARTMLDVPLRRDDVLLGVIGICSREARPYSDKQIALLQNFAAQAVIAMDNARLLDEIRQTQAELRATFDNMGDGVAMFDAEMRLAAWNKNFQELLDLPDEFVATRPTLREYFSYMSARGEYGSAGAELEAQIRRGVEIAEQESRFERTRPDGRVLEVRRNPVPGGGSVLIFSDITERKRAEAEIRAARDAAETALRELKLAQANLIQAEKMASLGQLTAGIAHEIKNPLNFVNNFAGLSVELLDELKAAAAPGLATLDAGTRGEVDETIDLLTGNLDKIAEHGRRADNIVKSMLEHSRGGSGDRRAVDLNSLVEEALNLAYHGARAQDQSFNITVEREFDADLAPIELVPQDVTRVFLNLFGNGFYAATRKRGDRDFRPMLRVATRDLGDWVEIRVRDNGSGIAPEIRDKLFQPFFTTKPTGEGTGLGLSISYDIVTQQHGGSIEVDSETGAYTEFRVRLPRASVSPSPASGGSGPG